MAERGQSRRAIFAAAAELFAERGYANTSVRDIAQAAGVDAALVIRHFGTKERLFIDSVELRADDGLPFDGPIDSLGEHLVRFVLDTDNRLRTTFLALVRASDSGDIGGALQDMNEVAFVEPLMQRLGEGSELRARLVAAMVGGLMYSLWVVGDERLRELDPEQIVAVYGAQLQSLLTP